MRVIKVFLILIFVINLSGCVSFRSAEGLNGGEVNISYVPPFSGAVRVGLTDNIEARTMIIFEALRGDVFLHTKNDSGKINYGLVLGVNFIDNKSLIYTGISVGIRESIFYPYLSFIMFPKRERKFSAEFSIGSEIKIYEFGRASNKFIFTPEVAFPIPPLDGFINTSIYGSVGIGFSFNFIELLK